MNKVTRELRNPVQSISLELFDLDTHQHAVPHVLEQHLAGKRWVFEGHPIVVLRIQSKFKVNICSNWALVEETWTSDLIAHDLTM